MKFSSATVLCLLASSMEVATSAVAGRLGLSQVQSLMSKAVPVTRSGEIDHRRLNDELTVTIYDSIAFNSCLTLTTSLNDKVMQTLQNDATLYSYWQAGQIVTTHSYVLFSICATSNCTSAAAEDALLMVDLESYMNLAGYRPQKTADYCTACVDAENYCLYTQYQTDDKAAAAGDDANAAAANGGRFLAEQNNNNNNLLKLPVNCTTCSAMGCFDNGAATDDGQVALADVVTWVEQLSQCQQLGVEWNDIEVYGQFMCNSKGNGVEIGIFLDNECTVYTSLESYGNLFQSSHYVNYSTNVVTYPFLNDINCAEDIYWVSPENYDASDSNADEAVDDKYAGTPNQYCSDLLQSKMVLPLDNCAYKGDDDAAASNDDGMFSGYSYDIANNDIDDADEVCKVIYNVTHAAGNSVAKNVENKNVFNSSNTLYNYQKKTASHSNKAGRAVGITFLVLAVVAAMGFVGYKALNAKKDSKKQPLVESQGGALA